MALPLLPRYCEGLTFEVNMLINSSLILSHARQGSIQAGRLCFIQIGVQYYFF